jgi:uncharacterized protein (DUF697 family)
MLPIIAGIAEGIISLGEGMALLETAKKVIGNDNVKYDNDNEPSQKGSNDNEGQRHDNDNDRGYTSPISDKQIRGLSNLSITHSYSISNTIAVTPENKKNQSSTTENLLDSVVNLLYIIQNTLQDQINFDIRKAKSDALIETETQLEKNTLDNKENVKPVSKFFKSDKVSSLLGILGIGGLLGVSGLDKKTLDGIGKNLLEFQKQYGWMIEIAAGVSAGAFIGSVVPVVGTFAGALAGGIISAINHYYPLFANKNIEGMPTSEGKETNSGFLSSIFNIRKSSPEEAKRNANRQKDYSNNFTNKNGDFSLFQIRDTSETSDATPNMRENASTNKPKSNQTIAYDFFRLRWSDEQAAGIVGNLLTETNGLDIHAIGDKGTAYGIGQWHPDRQLKFKEIIGKDIRTSNLMEQLEFVDWELNHGGPLERKAGRNLRKSTNASDAAFIVDDQYERSDGYTRNKRISNANAVLAGQEVFNGTYSNSDSGGQAENNTPETNTFQSIIDGLKSLPNTDTTYQGTIEEITKRNRLDIMTKKSIEQENEMMYGKDYSESPTIPQTFSPQESVKQINGGVLDVINPNYNMNESSILAAYLGFFELIDNNRSTLV